MDADLQYTGTTHFLITPRKELQMTIYDALMKDHDKVQGLMDELCSLNEGDDKRRHALIDQIRDDLIPHSRAEETVFYNSMRALSSANDVVLHGFEEHMMAETLLRTLQVADKIDMGWKATAVKLRDALNHHIKEEEGKIFTIAKQMFTEEEAVMMAEAFEELKPEIKKQGLVKTTVDLVANLLPPRIAAKLKTFNVEPPSYRTT